MSYDIYIVDDQGEVIEVEEPHNLRGGTYCSGKYVDGAFVEGTTQLHLNITYNYSMFYYDHFDKDLGIRWLYGRQVQDTIPKLLEAITVLEEQEKVFEYKTPERIPALVDDDGRVVIPERDAPVETDYWAATPRNAKLALQSLVALGSLAPLGYWKGD